MVAYPRLCSSSVRLSSPPLGDRGNFVSLLPALVAIGHGLQRRKVRKKIISRRSEICRMEARGEVDFGQPVDVNKNECALDIDGNPVVSCAGAGIFVFWQLGALKYITTHFDLSAATLHGGSAGAVLSTFIASGVDLNDAIRVSYDIGIQNKVWDRWSHMGLFGPLIKQWLEILLPKDAHMRCSGRVRLLLTQMPALRQQFVSEFHSREDLITAVMASIHVPFYLNFKPLKSFRGRYYMDGTLEDFISRKNSPILGCDGKAFVVDYYQDPKLSFGRLDFLRLKTHKEVLQLVRNGFQFARQLDIEGSLEPCLGKVRILEPGDPSRIQSHVRRA